jgi:hypothetical protein
MGNRNSIVIQEQDAYGVDANPLYLYSHWHGQELDQVVATALNRGRSRRNDSAYLTRIIVSDLLREDLDGTTGFGISQIPQDHDDSNHMIFINFRTHGLEIRRNNQTYTLEEFVAEFSDIAKEAIR